MASEDHLSAIIKRPRLLFNMAAGAAGAFISAGLAVCLMPMYMGLLGPTGFGIVGLIAILMGITRLLDMGLTASVNRQIAKYSCLSTSIDSVPNLIRTFELLFVGWGGLMFLVLVMLSPWIGETWIKTNSMTPSEKTYVFVLIAACALGRWQISLYHSCLLGVEKQALCSGIRTFEVLSQHFGGIVLLIKWHVGIQGYLVWVLINTLLFGVLSGVMIWNTVPGKLRSFCKGRFCGVYILETWKYAVGLAGVTVASTIFIQMDRFFVSLKSTELLGYYTPAIGLAAQATSLFSVPLFNAAYPNFTRLVHKKGFSRILQQYFFFISIIVPLAFSLLWFIGAYTPHILSAWFGNNTDVQNVLSPFLFWCVLGPALNALATPGYALQLAHGYPNIQTAIALSIIPFAAVGCWWQLGKNGLLGISKTMSIAYIIAMLITIFVSHRKFLGGHLTRFFLIVFICFFGVLLSGGLLKLFPYPDSASRLFRIGWLCVNYLSVSGMTLLISFWGNRYIEIVVGAGGTQK
ncbi:MAG: hypothetical protein K9N55_17820 [Phycisphaerae bacterium]|nr:hypothetical protein [Phycisphaerae bacterium]